MLLAKNYEDRKCHWGYATICTDCARDIKEGSIIRRGTDIDKEVKGFPLTDRCEECNRKLTKVSQ